MKSLRDVLPAGAETVILRQSLPEAEQIKVTLRGIDVPDFAPLLWQFPELYDALNGGKVDAVEIAKSLGAKGLVALIAAGCDMLGDEQAQAGIANLALFEKMALLAPILKRTMPDGAGPFGDLLRASGILGPRAPEQSATGAAPIEAKVNPADPAPSLNP